MPRRILQGEIPISMLRLWAEDFEYVSKTLENALKNDEVIPEVGNDIESAAYRLGEAAADLSHAVHTLEQLAGL